jgi:gamma-glutamylcyclotransferase (GGCT)/AIG2-like uncharacterized protein YtfP
MTKLFVYGTLLSEEPNHRVLRGARCLGAARTPPRFTMVDLGTFPGVVAEGATAIVGELYEVDAPTLAALDRLEGHPRFFRRTRIALDDGTEVESYLLTPEQVEARPSIASGNWRSGRKD